MGFIRNLPSRLVTFLKEVRVEMKKVNWPTREETVKFTLIVVIASAVVALFLGGLDYVFRISIERFLV